MKRKLSALLLAVLLLGQLLIPPAGAAESVYFTAAGENVLPLSDTTMPFWSGGYLYLPGSMFTGNVWRSLDVSYVRTSRQLTILHSRKGSLLFELGAGYAKDAEGNQYTPGMVERGGEAFVPAYLVADFFDLQYSVTKVSHGYLVWLRKPGFGLTDKVFADAATSNMENAYAQYRKSKESVPVPEEPETEKPVSGKRIYLCMEADEHTAGLLDELHRAKASAAFFCTPEFLAEQGDLLRRMMAMGHSVGILARSGGEISPEEQLENGNQALENATFGKTRLVLLENGSEEERQRLEQNGFCVVSPDLDRTAFPLTSRSGAASLMKKISGKRGAVSVWLGDGTSASGLRAFLKEVDEAEDHCLALTETTG